MANRETSRDIDQAAAEWAVRQERGPLSPDDERELAAWLDGDIRRPGALLRARAVARLSQSARALGLQYDPADFGAASHDASPNRRQVLTWGGTAAASVAIAAVAAVGLRGTKAYATERGEIRLAPLADGSTIMLNTDTLVRVRYDRRRRFVQLVRGEADFTVLSDPGRPFVVEAGASRFTSRGGAFRLRKLHDAPLDVLVHKGSVSLAAPVAAAQAAPLVLQTNTRFVVGGPSARAPVSPQPVALDAVARELAWRDGKIAFQGETLAQAAGEFARYSDVRIVIDDPALAREPVAGLYAANDPVGFSRAIAGLFGATVTQRADAVVLARAAH